MNFEPPKNFMYSFIMLIASLSAHTCLVVSYITGATARLIVCKFMVPHFTASLTAHIGERVRTLSHNTNLAKQSSLSALLLHGCAGPLTPTTFSFVVSLAVCVQCSPSSWMHWVCLGPLWTLGSASCPGCSRYVCVCSKDL